MRRLPYSSGPPKMQWNKASIFYIIIIFFQLSNIFVSKVSSFLGSLSVLLKKFLLMLVPNWKFYEARKIKLLRIIILRHWFTLSDVQEDASFFLVDLPLIWESWIFMKFFQFFCFYKTCWILNLIFYVLGDLCFCNFVISTSIYIYVCYYFLDACKCQAAYTKEKHLLPTSVIEDCTSMMTTLHSLRTSSYALEQEQRTVLRTIARETKYGSK